MLINVPEFLNIPEKLLPLITEFNNYRYFMIEGGRGGGKTYGVARLLTYIADKETVRIVCGREVQNTIDESVYTVFKDLMLEYDLPYDVLSNEIRHLGKESNINFKGFREQGRAGIKGLEGCSILWIDEAQSITKNTLDIIIPTIRKQKAKIFFTMNRWKKNDPVYQQFKDRDDCLHIKINYTDNPFCSQALIHEAEESKKNGEDGDYRHIWLGEPVEEIDNYLFSIKELEETKNVEFMYNEASYGYRIGAFDIARMGSDRSAFVVIEQKGPQHWEEIYTEIWKKKDLAHTTGRIIDRVAKFKLDITAIDSDGMGAGPADIVDFFNHTPKSIVEFRAGYASPDDLNITTGQKRLTRRYSNLKSWAWWQVKDMMENNCLRLNTKVILTDLETIMYDFKPNGERFIISKDDIRSKEKMRSMGISSPDSGDALMMAVSEIRNIKQIYDKETNTLPKYSQMDSDLEQELPNYARTS